MKRRIGQFEISMVWVDAEERPNILDRCLVLNVDHDFARRTIRYVAIHPDFDEIAEGETAPEYTGIFADGRRSPCWSRR